MIHVDDGEEQLRTGYLKKLLDPSKDRELCVERRKVRLRHCHAELFQREVCYVLVGIAEHQISQ